jgi:NADH-quinone oxidoreductase subunit M
MNLVFKLLFLGLALTPAATLFSWDGAVAWSLFNGITLSFDLTPLSAFFMLLLAIGAPLIAVPMLREKSDESAYALYALLLLGMQLLLLAGDFIGFFIGWEMMTWSSYLLLLRSPRTDLEGAQSYILFNLASAFLLLAGMLFLYSITDDFRIQAVDGLLTADKLVLFVLFGLAFLIKVGALPLHLWLPRSYDQAPDLFSAFLSALMSKMGIYGLMILPLLFPDGFSEISGRFLNGPVAGYVLAWIGVITATIATFKAISQEDMKRLLAYSSIAQVGYIVTALGVGSSLAIGGALFQALVHTLVKLLLFITIAGIILQTGHRRFIDLGQLISRMPISFFGVLIGIIGLAGMPPLPGFAAKYLMYVGLIEAHWLLLLAAMILASTASFVYCYKLIYGPFLGHANSPEAKTATEAPWQYLIPQIVLMGMLVALGIFPGWAIDVLIDPVLIGLNMTPIGAPTWAQLSTNYGGYDGVVLMSVFATVFVLITALFLLIRGNMHRAASPYDLSFCGEVPTADTPLHYGAGMGRELRRVPLIGWILRHTTTGFYAGLTRQTQAAAGVIGTLYGSNPQTWLLLAVLIFAVTLTIQSVTGA